MRTIDRLAAMLVCGLGIAHLAVGYRAFVDPTEPRIWFATAGFLLLMTGLANLAATRVADSFLIAAALLGNLSILMIGVLLAAAAPGLLLAPQAPALFALSAVLTTFRLYGSAQRRRAPGIGA